jgi:hypothetical protein
LTFTFLLPSCEGQTEQSNASLALSGLAIESAIIEDIIEELDQQPQEFIRLNYYYKEGGLNWEEEIDTVKNGVYFEKIPESKARSIVIQFSEKIAKGGNYIFLPLFTPTYLAMCPAKPAKDTLRQTKQR